MKRITSGFFGDINKDFRDNDIRRFESDLANASDYINAILKKLDTIRQSDDLNTVSVHSSYEEVAREIEFELNKLKMHLYPYIQ